MIFFLLAETTTTQPNSLTGNFQLVSQIVCVIFVLISAYFLTKLIANGKLVKKGNSNISIVESIGVGYQSSILLLKVGKKYILVGVSKDKITFLTEINNEEIVIDEQGKPNVSFEKYFNQLFPKKN